MEKLRTKLFACGTAAFMFLNALPLQTALTAFAAEAEAASRGDVNGDGKRNKDDLAALVKLLGEHPETIFAEKDFVQYDVTEDGIIDVRDQYALSQVLSGAAAEIPVKPGTALDESLTLAMTNATCFPGDEFRIALSVVDWTKDIAAYEITVGFDSALKLKDVSFISGDCQYAAASRSVKLSGLYTGDTLHRGDVAVLTFTAPTGFDELSEFPIQVEGANIFTSGYDIYDASKPETSVKVQPLYEPVSLQATGIGSKTVSLKWDMPYTDQPVTGYRIYRDGKKIGETTGLTYTDTKLEADSDYEYAVSAVTSSGTETAKSLVLDVHTSAIEITSADFPAESVSDANSDLTVRLSQAAPLSEMQLDIKGPDGKTVTQKVDLGGEDLSTINYHWDVAKLADGAYTISITIKDTDGLTASAETSVNVQNHPLKPVTLEAEAGGRTAVLTWTMAAEASATGYRVYRLNKDGKTWDLAAEITGRDKLSYTDTELTAGQKYTYAISTVDSYGQESEKSKSVSVTPAADKTAPEIIRFTPTGGQRVSGDLQIEIAAKDENGVAGVRCDLSADDGKTWKAICETEGDTLSWTINTADYDDGVYQLRAMAADGDKNETSGANVISIAFDNTAPEQVKNIRPVSVTPNAASLTWDDVADEDFHHFIAIVSTDSQTREYTIDKELGVNLTVVPDTRYTVTVYAVDTAGNAGKPSEPYRFVSNSDVTPPVVAAIGVSSEVASASAPLVVSVSASDTAGVSSRTLEYSQDQKTWKKMVQYDLTKNFTINDKTLKEGTLYLRAYATDRYGNTGDPAKAPVKSITVDNTAPNPPKKLTAEMTVSANVLQWTASDSEDVKYYRIDRSDGNAEKYVTIANVGLNTTYTDKNVSADGIYYYQVSAIDIAGNLSTSAKSGEVHRTPDKVDPVIAECGLTSGQQIVCSVHRSMQILATDDNQIASITAAYRCKDTDQWTALKTTETARNQANTELIVSAELPETILKERSVTVQVTAVDAAGNKAVAEYTYTVDDRKAEIKDAAAKSEGKYVTVSWTCPDVTGVSSFYLWRKIGAGGKETCIAKAAPKEKVTEYSCQDSDLLVGGNMIYRVMALMTNGNSVSVTLDPLKIQAIPQASLEFTSKQVLGMSYSYDARNSKNADDITEVSIVYGDGESAKKSSVKNALFTHTYKEAGTYDVSLTVTNASGLTDTFTGKVTVAEPDIMSTVIATVKKMDGTPAAGAAVYVDVGTEHQSKYMTDANGKVEIVCTAGDHEFGVFGNGYLPATQSCTTRPGGKTELEFSIAQDQLVKADFSVHRMSLSEIKAAGINVKDPENCQLVKIDVDLSYTVTTRVVDHIRIYYDRTNGIVVSSGNGSGGSGGSSSGYDYIVKTITHDVKTVVLMRVPVKAQFIKEFFKVDMIVMNNADAEFPLTDCTASLNLPSGLSLVEDAPSSAPRVVNLGTISGGSQQTVSWIVRGDRNGSYNFSADFSATLQPFNEPVSAHFPSTQPIKVYGQEAAAITVTFDPVLRNKTLYAEVLVDNQSPIDLNELSTDIGQTISEVAGVTAEGTSRAKVYQTRFIDTDGILQIIDKSKSISVLHPGQKFSVVYAINGILSSKLPGFYRKTEAEVRKSSTSSNVKVQVAPIKIANVNDPLYGIAFDPEHDFLFMVTNKNGDVISNANLTLTKGGSTVLTKAVDDRGRVVVPRGDDASLYHVAITAEGYENYDEDYVFPKRKSTYIETFAMSGDYEDNAFSLTYALFNSAQDGYIGLLSRTHNVDRNSDITFSITASVGKYNEGAEYQLVQENRVIKKMKAVGRTMAFMDLTPNMFRADVPVSIRIIASEGDEFETQLGLKIIEIPRDPSDSTQVQDIEQTIIDTFSDDFTVTVPAPLELQNKLGNYLDMTIMIPNLKNEDLDSPWSVNMKVDGEEFSFKITFSVSKELPIGPGKVEFGLEIAASGLIDLDKNVAEVSLTVTGSIKGSIETPEFRPPFCSVVFAKFTFSAKGSLSVTVKYQHKFNTPGGNSISIGLSGSFEIGVELAAGVGSEKIIAAEAYGAPSFVVEGDIVPDPKITKVALNIDAGFRIVALDHELEDFKIYNGTLQFYPRNGGGGRPRLLLPNGLTVEKVAKTPENYKAITAEDLAAAGEWHGQLRDSMTEIQSGIAFGSAPQIVSDGTTAMMVWTMQDAARGLGNASYLVYSLYDPDTKSWTTPKAVDDNQNADTSPFLFASEDGIRIAYLESAKVYEEGESDNLETYAKQLQFKTAKYDPATGTFTNFLTFDANKDGAFSSSPVFVRANDTTYLFWKSNANGQIFGNDESNMILCAKETKEGWDTPVVLAENLPELYGFTCGNDADGNPLCAYVTGKLDAEEHVVNTLFVIDTEGNVTELAAGEIGSPKFEKIPGKDASGLIWYQNGKLCATSDYKTTADLCSEKIGVTERYAIAGDRIIFLHKTNKRAEVFSTRYDAESGEFTNPVSIEAGEDIYYESICVGQCGEDTLYAMRRTAATLAEDKIQTSSALAGGILTDTADIRVGETAFSYENAAAGEKLPISMAVYNDGTADAAELTLHILDENGTEVASDIQTAVIMSGASKVVEFAPVMPENLHAAVYTAKVTASENDKTPDNNAAEIDLSKTDLAIETDTTYIGNKTNVTIFAVNRSSVPSAAVIHIKPASADEETLTLFSEEIAPHSSAYWRLDSADLLGDIYRGFVYVTVESEAVDANENNNQKCIILSKSGMDPYAAGDVNLDGTVELEDAMLALMCYTSRVANRSNLGFSYTQQRCADIDKDGIVDVTDAMGILRYYVECMSGSVKVGFTEYLAQDQNGGAKHESE